PLGRLTEGVATAPAPRPMEAGRPLAQVRCHHVQCTRPSSRDIRIRWAWPPFAPEADVRSGPRQQVPGTEPQYHQGGGTEGAGHGPAFEGPGHGPAFEGAGHGPAFEGPGHA